jgi:hypothetical protein
MRTTFLLTGIMALFVGGCSKGGGHAPPPLDKSLLSGKWKNASEAQFLTSYEFGADGTMKMTVKGMKEPIPGKFTWSSDRAVEVEYTQSADLQKAYEEAAKEYKDWVTDRVKRKDLSDRAEQSMLGVVADKLPPKERLTVGISDPSLLILTREDGTRLNFEKGK